MYSKISDNIKLLIIVSFKLRSFESRAIDNVYQRGDSEQALWSNSSWNGFTSFVSVLGEESAKAG